MKLFPNFTSIPFYYLLISWETNTFAIVVFLTCLSWFYQSRTPRQMWPRVNFDQIFKFHFFFNFEKQMTSCKSTGRELSFEWSHHRISSIDSKVRLTLQKPIKHSGSERVNSFMTHTFLCRLMSCWRSPQW